MIIVGGGLAGLAAAESISRLSPSVPVLVLEAKRRPGGRAGSYLGPDGNEVDYCQHVAMGCCGNLIDLIERCGLSPHFKRYRELTFLHREHPPSRFAPKTWLPAPLHLFPTISALRFLTKKQRREIKRGLLKLIRTPTTQLDRVTAGEWLRSAGQSEKTRQLYWDVILISALGEEPERVSMAAARKVLVDGFAVARGASDVLVPRRTLAELFGRMLPDDLESRGVEIHCGAVVKSIETDGTIAVRKADGSENTLAASAVISAVPWSGLDKLFGTWMRPDRDRLPDLRRINDLPGSPITGLHLWFDRPITDLDHAVMVGSVSQWLFNAPCQSRRRGSGEENRPGYYFQVIISASANALAIGKQALLETVLSELRDVFPDAVNAQLLHHRIVTDPRSVFSVTPNVESSRPPVHTDVDWLFLAGDWVQTTWPATMESAVISGRLAARAVLDKLAEVIRNTDGFVGTEPIPLRPPPGILSRLLIRR